MRLMKDSGVEYIGEIPIDWIVTRIKRECTIFTGNSIKNELKDEYLDEKDAVPYISTKDINADNGCVDYQNGLYVKKDDISFRIAPKNSTLLCIEGGSAGKKVTFTNQNVAFVNKLCCIYPNRSISKFINYYIQSPAFFNEFTSNLSGLIGGVAVGILSNQRLSLPNIKKQISIVDYLDQKISLIDKIIEKTKQSIEEYKKIKQSIITEAVTKGLNPDVKMKDSGIEWIGMIPEHWSYAKIKRVLSIPITDGPHETPSFIDEGVPFLSAESVKNNKLSFDLKRGYISIEDYVKYCAKCKPQIEDIFMVKSGATTGNIAIVETESDFAIWSPLALIRVNKSIISHKYLFYYLQSDVFGEQVKQFWNYGTQQNLGMGVLSNLYLSYPKTSEQEVIVSYLDNSICEVENLIIKKENLVNQLYNFKKSLIYEVVTGKKEIA